MSNWQKVVNEIPGGVSSENSRVKHALNKALSDCGHALFPHKTVGNV